MQSRFILPLLFLGTVSHQSTLMAQSPGTFTVTGSMTTERAFHTATLLANGRVLIAGGVQGGVASVPLTSAELYDPATGTFTATGSMTTPRVNPTATLLPNGMVLIAGGYNLSEAKRVTFLTSMELYDPSTGTFTATADMGVIRRGYTATLLNNGKVLIAGGDSFDGNGSCCSYLSRADLYDPSTGTFTATGNMAGGRAYHTATLLTNGKVLIEGGGLNSNVDTVELYDPESGTFDLSARTLDPSLRYLQILTSASLLTNGEVLVTLDDGCDPSDLAELYDPSTGAFSATGNMTAPRYDSTATLLPEGTVLIASKGYSSKGGSGADLFDVSTGRFRATGSPVTERQGHTATLLPEGTVLLSGGWTTYVPALASAEIYHPAVLVPSPVLLSLSKDAGGQGAVLHSGTHQIVSSSNPAVAGEVLEVYGSGLTAGSAIPPQVAIGGRMAQVLFFGNAPGYLGLNQINVRVPNGIVPGPAVSIRLNYLNRPSNEVTIGLQ